MTTVSSDHGTFDRRGGERYSDDGKNKQTNKIICTSNEKKSKPLIAACMALGFQ